jgi:3-oxoacyl-[acyl-carrier-protein] synthase-1
VTGWSILSAIGSGIDQTARALREEQSGLTQRPDWPGIDTLWGRIPAELPQLPASFARYDCRQSRLALATLEGIGGKVQRALRRWGPSRVAILLGTSTGGIDRTEEAIEFHRRMARLPTDYDMQRQHNFYAFCELLKHVTGITGPSYVVSTACSSSAKVFASAVRLMAADIVDAVLVGGVDTLCKTTLYGFNALKILAPERCRPFGKDRCGINIGEGGALLLLERSGDAEVALLGVGESSDAHHMTSPHPEGAGALFSMERALRSAGIERSAVDHINAHGTGTLHSDASEAEAIDRLFGPEVPVVSTKAFTGHTLGAAGAIEAIIACIAMREHWIPPSLGAQPVSDDIRPNINDRGRELRCRVVLSNSFGFGGNNVSLVLGATA